MSKPRVFIGSSSESKGIAEALEESLRDDGRIDRWDLDVFRPGHFTLEELTREAAEVDFAVFILGRDDVSDSRGKIVASPRDNVIFEAGLFTATLGRERVFYVVDSSGTKIPTDWAGLGYLTFDSSEERPRDQIFSAAASILKQLRGWTPIHAVGEEGSIVGHWWQFVESDDTDAVLSLLEITTDPLKRSAACVGGRSWASDGHLLAQYRSRATDFNVNNRTLLYYWQGEHPRGSSQQGFFGVGEITFEASLHQPGEATGWYSNSDRSNLSTTQIRSTRYLRATMEEIAIMKSDSRERRATVVNSKLQKRKESDV